MSLYLSQLIEGRNKRTRFPDSFDRVMMTQEIPHVEGKLTFAKFAVATPTDLENVKPFQAALINSSDFKKLENQSENQKV